MQNNPSTIKLILTTTLVIVITAIVAPLLSDLLSPWLAKIPYIGNPNLAAGSLIGLLVGISYLLIQINSLIQGVKKDLPQAIQDELKRALPEIGKDTLRDTIIDAVIKDAVQSAQGKARYHENALSFLNVLHEPDEKLSPAVEIIALAHVHELRTELNNLQQDTAKYEVIGSEQVGISQAFAEVSTSSIMFFDPTVYEDIENNWSEAFKQFVDKLNATPSKEQYILYGDVAAYTNNPDSNAHLKNFIKKMVGIGFQVYLVPASTIKQEGLNDQLSWRLEFYDENIVLKVQKKTKYDEHDKLEITVQTVANNAKAKKVISSLRKYRTKV